MCGVSGGTDRRRRVRGSRDQGQQTQRHSVCVGGRHCAALPRSTDSRHTADTHTAKRIPPPTTTAAPLTAGWAALTLSSTDDMRGSESRGIKCFYPWVFAGKKVFDPLFVYRCGMWLVFVTASAGCLWHILSKKTASLNWNFGFVCVGHLCCWVLSAWERGLRHWWRCTP